MPGVRSFITAQAQLKLEQIIDYVCAFEGMTTDEITAAFKWTRPTVEAYLRYARDTLEAIHELPRPKRIGARSGLTPLRWAGGPSPRQVAEHEAEGKPRAAGTTKVTIRRDPLHAAFFGPAQHKTN